MDNSIIVIILISIMFLSDLFKQSKYIVEHLGQIKPEHLTATIKLKFKPKPETVIVFYNGLQAGDREYTLIENEIYVYNLLPIGTTVAISYCY